MNNIAIKFWDRTILLQVYCCIYVGEDYVECRDGRYQIPERIYLNISSPIEIYCPPRQEYIAVHNAWIEPDSRKYGGAPGIESEGLLYLETVRYGQIATPVTFVE